MDELVFRLLAEINIFCEYCGKIIVNQKIKCPIPSNEEKLVELADIDL